MEQNNSNIPVVKIGDTIYESYGSYGKLCLKKVERITKTQIILNNSTKLRNNPLKMWGDKEEYYLNAVGKSLWSNVNYYLEIKELITQYNHEQLFLKTKKMFESLDLEKLTNEQLNILLSTMTQITTENKLIEHIIEAEEIEDKPTNKENQ